MRGDLWRALGFFGLIAVPVTALHLARWMSLAEAADGVLSSALVTVPFLAGGFAARWLGVREGVSAGRELGLGAAAAVALGLSLWGLWSWLPEGPRLWLAVRAGAVHLGGAFLSGAAARWISSAWRRLDGGAAGSARRPAEGTTPYNRSP